MSGFEVRLDNIANSRQVVEVQQRTGTVLLDIVHWNPPAEGMNLNFVAPSISHGISRAIVDRDEVSKLKMQWNFYSGYVCCGF